MYHLFVAGQYDAWDGAPYSLEPDRVIQAYTSTEAIKDRYKDLTDAGVAELQCLPAIFSYELANKSEARIGYVKNVTKTPKEVTIEYAFFPDLPPIPFETLSRLTRELLIEKMELHRTHWAIKAADLFQVLVKIGHLTKKHLANIPQQYITRAASQAFPPHTQSTGTHDPGMSEEEKRNSGLILLMLLAQAYYKMLESVSSAHCSALDIELNQSYLWTINGISDLLKNHEDLKDFPIQFEPVFPDLYPSTVRDVDWEDMVAPEADKFLSTVQKYVTAKGIYDPEKGTSAWIFVELYRPSVNLAIERAIKYNKKMYDHVDTMINRVNMQSNSVQEKQADKGPTVGAAKSEKIKRDKVFISYSHKDRKHYEDFFAHLKPLIRANQISAWSDDQIKPGSKWLDEVRKAVESAKVAVLLVTKDFLASDFIYHNELCPLLKAAQDSGVAIRWVLVRDCNWKNTPLETIQAAYPTEKALVRKTWSRDEAWVSICQCILKAAEGEI